MISKLWTLYEIQSFIVDGLNKDRSVKKMVGFQFDFVFFPVRNEASMMFHHAYDSYLRHAYPYDELRPLSCSGVDTWGSYSLTLIDALDTLAVLGTSIYNK